jgi:glycine cleavage system H protein
MPTTFYTKDHEYVKLEGDIGTIGITDYAQDQLGDVVFVELPELGKQVSKGAEAAVVESVKAASEVYAPISGEVTAINESLQASPAAINEDPEGKGWFIKIKIKDKTETEALMTKDQYKAYITSVS